MIILNIISHHFHANSIVKIDRRCPQHAPAISKYSGATTFLFRGLIYDPKNANFFLEVIVHLDKAKPKEKEKIQEFAPPV